MRFSHKMCDTRRVETLDVGFSGLRSHHWSTGEPGGNPGLPRSGKRMKQSREPEYLRPVRVPPARAVRDLEGGSQGEQATGRATPVYRTGEEVPATRCTTGRSAQHSGSVRWRRAAGGAG
ncbi:hypothetical protein GCM10022235_34550 [Kribbella ginsengisoli]|uniref:Uncharacterized protein n=1 Tax=Kribbella ginsengisoli TaxID=363865 RepID=A0ABP6X923_9ACTN